MGPRLRWIAERFVEAGLQCHVDDLTQHRHRLAIAALEPSDTVRLDVSMIGMDDLSNVAMVFGVLCVAALCALLVEKIMFLHICQSSGM